MTIILTIIAIASIITAFIAIIQTDENIWEKEKIKEKNYRMNEIMVRQEEEIRYLQELVDFWNKKYKQATKRRV